MNWLGISQTFLTIEWVFASFIPVTKHMINNTLLTKCKTFRNTNCMLRLSRGQMQSNNSQIPIFSPEICTLGIV